MGSFLHRAARLNTVPEVLPNPSVGVKKMAKLIVEMIDSLVFTCNDCQYQRVGLIERVCPHWLQEFTEIEFRSSRCREGRVSEIPTAMPQHPTHSGRSMF
jgi:hypothetical protein